MWRSNTATQTRPNSASLTGWVTVQSPLRHLPMPRKRRQGASTAPPLPFRLSAFSRKYRRTASAIPSCPRFSAAITRSRYVPIWKRSLKWAQNLWWCRRAASRRCFTVGDKRTTCGCIEHELFRAHARRRWSQTWKADARAVRSGIV